MKDNIIVDLNEIFNEYFFKNFSFIIDNKIIKQGRLKLFTMKSFNLKFFLIENDNSIKVLEIPYPFEFKRVKDGYLFDYRLKKIKTLPNTELINNLLEENCVKSRFYDKTLLIKIE